MAPGPVQLQQNAIGQPSDHSTASYDLGNLSLPTQEEAQVCTRMMSTLLECRLQEALLAEAGSTLPVQIYFEKMDKNAQFVNCYDRDRMVKWLCGLTHDFHYCLEVFFRATSILDSFLSVMRVQPKFLQCVTATCFFIASKLEEKPESVDTVLAAMMQNYSCEFSARDVHRMELIVMQKLDFKLNSYTLYDFLKIFHIVGITDGSLMLPLDLSPEQHLCHTALCMEEVVSNHTFMKFKPSLLALAVLGCDLKLLGCDWLTAVVTLQKLAGVRGGELSVCYEAVAPFYNVIARRHPLYISSKPPCPSRGKAVPSAQDGSSSPQEGHTPKDHVPLSDINAGTEEKPNSGEPLPPTLGTVA